MENHNKINTQKGIKTILSRESFREIIKQNDSLDKNLGKLNRNYYTNMKSIFDSDEKKINIISFIDKLRTKDRLKQKSVSPLIKDYEPLKFIEYNSPKKTNKNHYSLKTANYNKKGKNFYNKIYEEKKQENNYIYDENMEIENRLNYYRNNIPYHMSTAPIFKIRNKKDQYQITFIRINITTIRTIKSKSYVNNNKLTKENFSLCFESKNQKNENKNNNENLLQINSYNLNFKPNNINDNFTGFKLIKFNNGILQKEFLLNESIEELNKKFSEELIKINNIPLKLNNKIDYSNEIDLTQNFNILSSFKKEDKNLVNKGMNTIKDKRKFIENGVNVDFNPITSNSGNNTDINLKNWNYLIENLNPNDKNNFESNQENENPNIKFNSNTNNFNQKDNINRKFNYTGIL